MKKVLGFILIAVGALIILLSFQQFRTALGLELPPFATDTIVMTVGGVIIVIGAVLSLKKKNKQHGEVPIYHGKNIVGYRRV